MKAFTSDIDAMVARKFAEVEAADAATPAPTLPVTTRALYGPRRDWRSADYPTASRDSATGNQLERRPNRLVFTG
jgi:hypothetical protein